MKLSKKNILKLNIPEHRNNQEQYIDKALIGKA